MAEYQFYFFDASGEIMRRERAVSLCDSDALEEARERDHRFCVEVWHGMRLVAAVDPKQQHDG